MKKAAVFVLLLSSLALCWAGASPALAYYAPLQDVTGPTVAQNTDTRVTVSVHNPATGQDIPYTWTIAGGAAAITVDQLSKDKGIVAWRVKDLTNNKYQIVCGVYDPGWAALQSRPADGWMFSETWPWIDYDTNIIAVNDGAVVYETKHTSGGQTNIMVDLKAYNPSGWYEEFQHGWMPYGWREGIYTISNYSGLAPRDYTVKDGVVAFIYDGIFNGEVDYAVFDGPQDLWQLGNAFNSTNAKALQITNATVTWTDDSGAQKRGYDYTDQTWKAGVDTKVMAYYDFWPTPAKPGEWVYFTDMSIAATAWNWTLGDGGTSIARSLYHKYLIPGNYTAQQQVTGPAGTDSNSQTVPVKSSAISGPLMLLLFD